MIQRRLEIGRPDDKYEKEADAVADQVMRMPSSGGVQMKPADKKHGIQMKCTKCEEEEKLQMKPANKSGNILRMKSANGGTMASEDLTSKLQGSQSAGQRLPEKVSSEMGSKMGADLSGVKVHTGSNAIQMSREIGAQAFTYGSDIYFNQGKYNPENSEGKHLLAHELTHVVQQKGGTQLVQRACGRDNDRTVSGFPATYIEHIDVNVTNPCRVTLRWAGTNAGSQPTGPFHGTIGNGAGTHDCNDVAVSNTEGSNCTPKGDFTIEKQTCALGAYPEAKNASYFDKDRGIAFHYWRNRPDCPASHGCVRMSMEHSELIWDNCINEKTSERHGKPATTVHVGGTWSACNSE